MSKIRVLVVDDSTLFRKIVRDVLAKHPDVEVVGSASDGIQALEKIDALQPGLITLDMQMPNLDGREVLKALRQRENEIGVLMLSALTDQRAQETVEALELGAFDFILKPQDESFEQNLVQLEARLLPKIDAWLARTKNNDSARLRESASRAGAIPAETKNAPGETRLSGQARILSIGISTGGPTALMRLIPRIPRGFPVPIVIVQHMPPLFTRSLATDLNRDSEVTVMEGEDGMVVRTGCVYIAPGGRQMRIGGNFVAPIIEVRDDAPERNCRPSVDYLFRSVAEIYGAGSIGCVMTGMGDDGLAGSIAIRRAGGFVIAQDQTSCTVYGMPRVVVEAGLANEVCSLNDLLESFQRLVGLRGASCR